MKVAVTKASQDGVDIYVGVLPAKDLVDRAKVDVWAPGNKHGYQRDLAGSRIREVVHYLEKADGVFPTSVLLSYRSEKAEFSKGADGGVDNIVVGTLSLDENEPLYVIDGQHRIAALREAMASSSEWGSYPIPFTLMVNGDVFDEARWFYVVNSTAKRVPVGLAEQLLADAVDEKGEDWLRVSTAPETSSRGDKVVITTRLVRLVDHLEEGSVVWKGHIIRPGETATSPEDVRHHQVVTSLDRGAASDRGFQRALEQAPEDLAKILSAFWDAIGETWPEAIADGKAYNLRRTQGLYAMHSIFPDVLEICKEARKYDQAHIARLLADVRTAGVDDDFWSTDNDIGHVLTQATSMAVLRRLASYLRERLPDVVLPGL